MKSHFDASIMLASPEGRTGGAAGSVARPVLLRRGVTLAVTLYGRFVTPPVFGCTAFWSGALREQPVRIVVVRDPEAIAATRRCSVPTSSLATWRLYCSDPP
jgi:hypothetical protein